MFNKTILSVKSDILKEYINDYWVIRLNPIEDSSDNDSIDLPPIGFPVIHIHFGSNTNLHNLDSNLGHINLTGQITTHVKVFPKKGIEFLGINFKPYGLYNLMGIKMDTIKDCIINAESLFDSNKISALISSLKKNNFEEAIDSLEHLLIAKMGSSIKVDKEFDRIVDLIVDKKGLLNISNLVESNRNLQRYFKKTIGISAKLFAQILRHKFILENIYSGEKVDWDHFILNGYYYDLSHFNKDFIKFAKIRANKYLQIKNSFTQNII